MAPKSVAAEFEAKIARALASDAGQRELTGFVGQRVWAQPALLDCLWTFSISFDATRDGVEEAQKQRGRAILYTLFARAIELADPWNELADFVLYVAALAIESRGGKKDTRPFQLPAMVEPPQYVVYRSQWSQMAEQEQAMLRQRAHQKRQSLRNTRTLAGEVMNAYLKVSARTPTLEQLFDFDPAPKTPRKALDLAIAACDAKWFRFSFPARVATPVMESYLKEMDTAFEKLREVLLSAGNDPLAFYQMWKWIRDGRTRRETGGTAQQGYPVVDRQSTSLWPELYLEACYCAIRLATGTWGMREVQKAKGLCAADRDFILQPVEAHQREHFATRLQWGANYGEQFAELNRVRRRMNRFAAASGGTIRKHLDEFETVELLNKISRSNPAVLENKVVQASSRWVAFRDKHHIGQELLDSFTIVWLEESQADSLVFVEFHNLPYQLFVTTSGGLGDLVRDAVWRKMRELGDQVIQFLLAYLEVVGLVVDVITAGQAGGVRRIVFQFLREKAKDKISDEVLEALHVENPALRLLAGIAVNAGPKLKLGPADVIDPNVGSRATHVGARGVTAAPDVVEGKSKALRNNGVPAAVSDASTATKRVDRPRFDDKPSSTEFVPGKPQQMQQQQTKLPKAADDVAKARQATAIDDAKAKAKPKDDDTRATKSKTTDDKKTGDKTPTEEQTGFRVGEDRIHGDDVAGPRGTDGVGIARVGEDRIGVSDRNPEPRSLGKRKLSKRGKPMTPVHTGTAMGFQTPIPAPQRVDIGGAIVSSRYPDALVGWKKPHHREDVALVINADPNHPMRRMLDKNTAGSPRPRFVDPGYGKGQMEDWREHPEDWQSGHARSARARDTDVLVVQTRARNQRQGNLHEQPTKQGTVTMDSVVVIGGIAVEKSSAWDLWVYGYVNLSYEQMTSLPELKL